MEPAPTPNPRAGLVALADESPLGKAVEGVAGKSPIVQELLQKLMSLQLGGAAKSEDKRLEEDQNA